MRWFGCLLMALAGAGMGLYAAHRLLRQAEYLGQVTRLFQVLERQLPYTALPMSDLWRRLAELDAYADCALLRDTVTTLPDSSFTSAYAAAVERAQRAGMLTPNGVALLTEFAADCGRYDLTRQTEHIRHFRLRAEELTALLEHRAAAQGKLYRTAGLAGGVALALLLL